MAGMMSEWEPRWGSQGGRSGIAFGIRKLYLVKEYMEIGDLQLSTPRLTTGLSKIDKALGPIIGVSYYEAQMKRLAKGRSVTISQNAWPYLLQTVKAHGLSALKSRRKREY